MIIQVNCASQHGLDILTTDLSIEVGEVNTAHLKMKEVSFQLIYGCVNELWEVRQFYVKSSFGKLVNILSQD